jgi:hypothetical protein
MALTVTQKSAVRRHLGYPAIGLLRVSPGGGTLGAASAGYRYNDAYGFLEYRLNNLNPDEEARLMGVAYGAVILTGPQPAAGDQFSVTFSGGPLTAPVTVTVTAQAPNGSYDNRINVVNALAGAISTNATLQANGFLATAPYGTGPFSQNAVAIPEVGFTNAQTFGITCSGTGSSAPQVSAPGQLLPPSAQLTGINGPTTYGYIPILDGLEAAYGGASDNLDTAQADVWRGRSNELGQRMSLYQVWVDKLVDFIGVPRNDKRKGFPERRGAMRYA